MNIKHKQTWINTKHKQHIAIPSKTTPTIAPAASVTVLTGSTPSSPMGKKKWKQT